MNQALKSLVRSRIYHRTTTLKQFIELQTGYEILCKIGSIGLVFLGNSANSHIMDMLSLDKTQQFYMHALTQRQLLILNGCQLAVPSKVDPKQFIN